MYNIHNYQFMLFNNVKIEGIYVIKIPFLGRIIT